MFALAIFVLLLFERSENSWSGNDPINKALLIPCIFIANVAIFFVLLALFRMRVNANRTVSTFLGGLISGASLLILPHLTARFLSGMEIFLLLGCGLSGIAIAWLSAVRGFGKK